MWHILTLVRFLKVQNGKTKTVDAFSQANYTEILQLLSFTPVRLFVHT